MPLIDDEGNLFGVVNVIDALAVVLLCAVLVAGIAFVGVLGTDGEPETRYATIDLGEQPDYVVDRVSEGDTASPEGTEHNLTVTDVYVTPSAAEDEPQPHVAVRAEVNGERIEDGDGASTFEFAGEHLRVGSDLDFDTDDYVTSGEVTDLSADDASLGIEETPVLLESTVSETTANEIEEGDTVELGPHTTATMTDVQLYPLSGDQYRTLVGVDLAALQQGSTTTYGGQPVTVDSSLQLHFDSYDLDAEVVRRGTDSQAGEPTTTTTAEMELENVRESVANGLEAGMTETVRGETLATIQSVERQPADVVLESEDGDIHLREHPTNEDVTLTVELQTRETDTGLQFHGESLSENEEIVLDFGTKTVEGVVLELE
ncbi:DUF4330 family protein [Natrialbaceae archaeon A-arb3/5]